MFKETAYTLPGQKKGELMVIKEALTARFALMGMIIPFGCSVRGRPF